MKSVLIAIKPKWCELIASGKKTIEVRKTRPKLDTPFKCYIYETKDRSLICVHKVPYLYSEGYGLSFAKENRGIGKVIGEFVCDEVSKFTAEFVDDGKCYEDICYHYIDVDGEEEHIRITTNERDNPSDCWLCRESCLSFADIKKYIATNFHEIPFYGWHISDLQIYDEPKELSEFYNKCPAEKCEGCEHLKYQPVNSSEYDYECEFLNYQIPITRPPQSWCYVERAV